MSVGIQMEITWHLWVKNLSKCGHLPLGNAFMNLLPVETCSILVFFTQATPLSWLSEDTRYICVLCCMFFLFALFIVLFAYIYIYICFLYNNLCVFTIVGQQCKYNSTTCTYFIIIIHVTLLIKKNVGYRGNFFWGYQAVRTKLKGIKLC